MSPVTYGTMTPRDQALGSLASVFVPLAVLGGAQALGGAVATQSVWRLGWAARGIAISDALGANLPRNFPVLDKFINGVATSIKSMDLNAPAYQNIAIITSRLNSYVDSVANFSGKTWGGSVVNAAQIVARQLQLAIPANGATAVQQLAIDAAALRARGLGVTVIVTSFP